MGTGEKSWFSSFGCWHAPLLYILCLPSKLPSMGHACIMHEGRQAATKAAPHHLKGVLQGGWVGQLTGPCCHLHAVPLLQLPLRVRVERGT